MFRRTPFVSALLCLPFLAASSMAGIVDFSNLSSTSAPSVSLGGITVTGSADVNIENGIGLGIVGGTSSTAVDGAEYLEFVFTAGAALRIQYYDYAAWDLNTDGTFGSRTLEAFDVDGHSLGTVSQSDAGYFAVSSLFGNVPISKFRLTANQDGFMPRAVRFDTVPEASAYLTLGSGLAAIALLRRRLIR